MHKRILLASAIGLTALAAPAFAVETSAPAGSGQFTINLVGHVPVICRTSVDASLVTPAAGTVQLGSLREFCNNPNGYRVHADYSASLANAKLLIDGSEVTLGAEGTAVISASSGAGIASHDLSLELPEGVSDGSISFRIEPL